VRVIVCELVEEAVVEGVIKAARDGAWDVRYWTAYNFRRPMIEAAFPNAVYHDTAYATRGLSPTGDDNMPEAVIDASLLRTMAPYESMFMQMLDRTDRDGSMYTHRERLRMYQKMLRQWKGVIETHQPDLVVFSITPHAFFDFVLYGLCQHLDIGTIWFDRTAFPGRMLPTRTYRTGCKELMDATRKRLGEEGALPELPAYMEDELAYLRSAGAEATSVSMRKKIVEQRFSTSKRRWQRLWFALKRELGSQWGTIRRNGFWRLAPRNYLKMRGRPMEESWMKFPEWALYRLHGMLRRERLRAEYEDFAAEPELGEPYVIVALQNQPERMTCPLAEGYEHQHVFVRLLSKVLPQGWRIYVKEHPWQLSGASRGQLSRWPGYYRELASIPNVTLVPIAYPGYKLLDAAKGVATLTGSMGFQAVVRGKPVLVGGFPWYRNMEGVYHGDTEAGCRAYFEAIERGDGIDQRRFLAFLLAIDEVACRCWMEKAREDNGGVSADECRDNVAAALVREGKRIAGRTD